MNNRRPASRILRFLVAAVLLLGIGSASVLAQVAGSIANLQQASGKILSIDVPRSTFQLEFSAIGRQPAPSSVKPTTFMTDEQTTISKGSQHLELGSLKPGDQVQVEYVSHEGENLARFISVQSVIPQQKSPQNPSVR
ncbi:MAG: hypothetical protein HYU33_00725 [Candidatus Omnitrophica bacterium]|nr:hypothetical protein [Candidatus Omnitrophota bacterium]MBI3009910.1 hypothetical protein [Candidatus Omnitrophota bacterium]